jgi:hypothetical protein
MISGAHIVLYTKNPEAYRAFFKDVLELKSMDAGRGWLIFALRRLRQRSIRPKRMALTSCFSCAMT